MTTDIALASLIDGFSSVSAVQDAGVVDPCDLVLHLLDRPRVFDRVRADRRLVPRAVAVAKKETEIRGPEALFVRWD